MKEKDTKYIILVYNFIIPKILSIITLGLILHCNLYSQLHIQGNSDFYISAGAQVQVNTSLEVFNAASILTQVGNSTLNITGSLTNNGTVNLDRGFSLGGDMLLNTSVDFTTNSTTITFNGPSSQTITAPSGTVTFYDFYIDKTGGNVYLAQAIAVNNIIRLISNALLDIGTYNLTLGINANVFSDYATSQAFTASQCVFNSQGANSGFLVKIINSGASLPLPTIKFPLGTPGSSSNVYTPAEITVSDASLSPGAYVEVKAINSEHPKVEITNISLKKYWVVNSGNIVFNPQGANVLFHWDPSEEAGNVGEYKVLYYAPSYPDPTGFWTIDPGAVNISDFNSQLFYSQQVSKMIGDWTTGEENAGRATYYSITDNGDYNTPGTWSKVGFGGPPSATAPNKQSDRVRINVKVRITGPVSNVGELSVEAGGTLRFETDDAIGGNIFRVEDNASLEIAGQYGITASGTGVTGGNVQTSTRTFSSNAVYKYISITANQQSGDAVPSPVSSVVCDKVDGTTLTLSKNIAINDSLVINAGTLDIGSYSIDGNSSGRTFTMRGGELVVRNTYPINYLTNTFTSGTITFDGTGNVTIPSSASGPAVAQYNCLTIRGNRAASSNITFQNQGDINIISDFDISALNFAGVPTQKFFTDGSTVIFKKTGGFQNIQCRPASPINDLVNLGYYNLKIQGTGLKQLFSSVASTTFDVTNQLTLESSTFSANNFDLKILGNWSNTGGFFNPANSTVDFNSPVLSFTNTITSRNQTENPFHHVIISGPGNVQPLDDIRIEGNLSFMASSNLTMSSSTVTPTTMTLLGNWTNQGGTFSAGGSLVNFAGTVTQLMSRYNAGNETFYNATVNNPNNLDVSAVGTSPDNGIVVINTLSLPGGNVRSRGRQATIPQGALITRPGTTPGHIDGALRKYVDPSAGSTIFEVGFNKRYTPASLSFNGTGGSAGMVSIMSDTMTATTSPVTVGINPAGSGMSDVLSVRRQWSVSLPAGSTFSLGTRTYNIVMSFISAANPNGDLRNGADPLYFESRLYSGASWIAPYRFGSPQTGTRTASTTEYRQLSAMGTFIIGEPSQRSFYSIASTNWTVPSSWSTQGYNGPASAIAPTIDALVYIGNSRTITLDATPVTVNGTVTIDSSGTLIFGTNILSGSGEFRITKDASVSLGDVNGITSAGSTGNVQVSIRSYNYNNNNRGHFTYTGGLAQATGNGLPDTVASLTVLKSTGSVITLSKANNVITDSLFIEQGSLNCAANNISLIGNWRINGTGVFTPGTGTFNFVGTTSQTVTALNNLTFNNLTINNPGTSTKIVFMPTVVGTSQNITVNAALTFAASNLAYIDLSPSSNTATGVNYNQGEWFMTIANPGGSVTRTGQGHVNGELRKWVPEGSVGNATNGTGTGITFEVGIGPDYNPFTLRLTNTPSNDVAGYCGIQVLGFMHPDIFDLTTIGPPAYSYPPERAIAKYWRMVSPATNGWVKGDRVLSINGQYLNPQDIPGGALIMCFDFAFWKGPLSTDWQRLRPPSATFNDGSFSTCGDRNQTGAGGATYSPRATIVSTMGYNISTTILLGNRDLGLAVNDRLLNGDWVLAQQGPGITYYYSKNNGNWTDSSTWVTGSYSSNVNDGSFLDGITQVGKYPMRRTDIAVIGEGKTVTLDANIGNGWPSSTGNPEFHEQRLGAVYVEKTAGGPGKLLLGTNVIRASVFILKDGGIVSSGAGDGFSTLTNRGNLQREYSGSDIARDFNYNNHKDGNYIFNAKGIITTTYLNADFRYCDGLGLSTGGGYIARVRVSNGAAFGIPFFDHADNRQSLNAFRYFPDKCIVLTAGSQYTMRIVIANTGSPGSYYGTFWLDQNFNATYENTAAERYPSAAGRQFNIDSSMAADISFTVPANTPAGTTQMRIIVRNNSNSQDPCAPSGTGEVQDYTVNIINNSFLNTLVQNTGGAIPDSIASITVSTVNTSSTVTQTKYETVKDSVYLTAGTYTPNTQTLNLQGDFVNNNIQTAFGGGVEGTLTFDSTATQKIRGSSSTSFYKLTLNKPSGTVQLNKNTTVNNQLIFNQDNYLQLLTNNLIFGPSAVPVSPGAGSFSGSRMILSEGSATIGSIIKQYTGSGGAKSYFFPIGVGKTYNPASISVTGTYTASPYVAIKLRAGLHPNRVSDNILGKFWNVASSGISNITANSLSFTYVPSDVNGNQSSYIPALFKTNNLWEINLGVNPSANPSPISITNSLYFDGDWTAGEAPGFFKGRIFWSRNTGNWNIGSDWSNESHTGVPSAYYPGQIYDQDTVIIDGHTITYNVADVKVDSLQIGGPSNTASALPGSLQFSTSPVNKSLTIKGNLGVLDDGIIGAAGSGNTKDTLSLYKNLYNISTILNAVNLYTNGNNYTVLRFNSPSSSTITASSSTISGEGNYAPLGPIILEKINGFTDTLVAASNSFNAQTGLNADYLFNLNKGILRDVGSNTLWLSGGANVANMSPYTGIDILNGAVSTSNNLVTNVNTRILLNGGNLNVGDAVDEHFLYKTGTKLKINNGQVKVAGCFTRNSGSDLINLNLTSSSTFIVMSQGNTDPTKTGFDISNSSSSFSMSGGSIIIASGTTGASSDFKVAAGAAANGTGMTGGTIQTGYPALPIATPVEPIKLAGTMPVWDVHATRSGVKTYITEQNFLINDNLTIDNSHTFSLNGNTVQLRGNLQNDGIFFEPSGAISNPWLLVFDQNNSQTITNNETGGLKLYKMKVDKPAGSLYLGNTANSNLVIRNSLEFSTNNLVTIDARTNNKDVELNSNVAGTDPQVLRNGQGHVDGLVYRYYPTGAKSLSFPVGATAIGEYRPVTFEAVGTGGTAGIVGAIASVTDHPAIANPPIKLTNYVHRYWTISTNGFALGANRTYTLTTYYLPGDPITGPTTFYEHHLYTPAYPAAGSWQKTSTTARTATYVTSSNNTNYGDFVAGEPSGYTYWSYDNGTWDNSNTAIWSLDSYTSKVTPVLTVPGVSDIVHIGNSRTITIPDGYNPEVRILTVEKDSGSPGALFIKGSLGYVKSNTFILEDSTSLGVQHIQGISADGSPSAVYTSNVPSYGNSRYIYNGSGGGQSSGRGLPDTVISLTIDNTSSPNNVYLSQDKYGNINSYMDISEDLKITNGTLNFGSRNINLFRNMKIQNLSKTVPLTKGFVFREPSNHVLAIENQDGVNFYDLGLAGGNLLVTKNTLSNTAHVYVAHSLNLTSSGIIDVRTNDRKVIIQNGGTVNRTGSGYIDGYLEKTIPPDAVTLAFEIGNGPNYTPATITITGTGGTAGAIDAINLSPVPNEVNSGNRMDQAHCVPRYWSLEPITGGTFLMGARTANVNLHFPPSDLATVNTANAVVRRKSVPAETPLWSERADADLNWNTGLASVELSGTATLWAGLGDFFIGEKAPRTFYSVANGNWNTNTTWTFNSNHLPPVCPETDDFPNATSKDDKDIVEIGLNHTVTLNVLQPRLNDLSVINNSKLDLQSNSIYCSTGSGSFTLNDNAFLSSNLNSFPNNSLLNFVSYFISVNSTIDFYGNAQTILPNPFGLADVDGYGNVLLRNGTKDVTAPVLIRNNLTNQSSNLNINTLIDALHVRGSVINSAPIYNDGVIEIGY